MTFATAQNDDTKINLFSSSGTNSSPSFVSGSLLGPAVASPFGFTPGMMPGQPGSPQYNMNLASSGVNNLSIFSSGWLGGDPESGHNGDVGNYAHIDNTTTSAQASAAAAADPTVKEPFYAGLKADVNQAAGGSMAGLKAAVTGTYSQEQWFLNNINFGNTSGESVSVGEAQIISNTATQAGVCMAGLGTAALLAATTPESAGTTVLAATFATGLGSIVAVVNDCYAAVSDWGSSIGAALQADVYGASGATSAEGHDFQDPGFAVGQGVGPAGPAAAVAGSAKSDGVQPSMAYISSIASHLTAASHQYYFGNT